MRSANSCDDTPATGNVSIDFPARITVTVSAAARISSSLCVIRMIDLPSLAKLWKIAISSSISCGVSTAVGSSKIKISAPR